MRIAILGCFSLLLASIPKIAGAGPVELLSKRHPSSVAPETIGSGGEAAVSADGRWVAFTSTSPNLVAGQNDANEGADVFLLDRVAGTVTLVSHAAGFPLTTGTEISYKPSISADGRYIAFQSPSANLVSGQTNRYHSQVFLYDRDTDSMTLVSHAAGSSTASVEGTEPVVSKDGNWVTFVSRATNLVPGQNDTNGKEDVFLFDRSAGTVTLVSRAASGAGTAGNGKSLSPVLSADGRYVLFSSEATDLVPGQTEANPSADIFLYDRVAGTTTLVSRKAGFPTTTANSSSYFHGLGLSDDGSHAVFKSAATDLVSGQVDTAGTIDVFLFDRATEAVVLVSHAPGSAISAVGANSSAISADGAWVAFESYSPNAVAGQIDTNGERDIFLYQRATGATILVSHSSSSPVTAGDAGISGPSFTPLLSQDGRYVLFESDATDLVAGAADTNGSPDVFLFDRVGGTSVLASHGEGSSTQAGNAESEAVALSVDGSHAVLTSMASDLTGEPDADGDWDLFLFSRAAGTNTAFAHTDPVTRLSGNGATYVVGASRDGRFSLLYSKATDLVEGQIDTNEGQDFFLVDRLTGTTTLVTHADGAQSTAANKGSGGSMSADGNWVVFDTNATDVMPDINPASGNSSNVFLYSRADGSRILVSRKASDPSKAASGTSRLGVASADGRYVAFASTAWNLVDGQIGSGDNVFLFDRVTGGMALASHLSFDPLRAAGGSAENGLIGISSDGRYVAFPSRSTALVAGQADTNAGNDLFLYDRVTAGVTLVSRSAASPTTTANAPTLILGLPALSADGRFFAFESPATDLVSGQADTNGGWDVFLFDRLAGNVTLVSRKSGTAATTGNGTSGSPRLSADGRFLLFSSLATDLVPGQVDLNQRYDTFLYDVSAGTLTLLSPDGISTSPTASTASSGISDDGRYAVLQTEVIDWIPGQIDQNNIGYDLILLDRTTGTRRLLSHVPSSFLTTANNDSYFWSHIRGGGSLVFFSSGGSDLSPGDYNGALDAFVHSSGATPASDFYTLTPCRVLDTRQTGALSSGVSELASLHDVCGIPATAKAVAVNVTVVEGSASGNLTLYPGDVERPPTSTINFPADKARGNNAILPLAFDGTGTLAITPFVAGGGTVHVIVDVSGWFE